MTTDLLILIGLCLILAGILLYMISSYQLKKLERREKELDKSFKANSMKGWKEYE